MAHAFMGREIGEVFEQEPYVLPHLSTLPKYVPNEAAALITFYGGQVWEKQLNDNGMKAYVCAMFFCGTPYIFKFRFADGTIGFGKDKIDASYFHVDKPDTSFVSGLYSVIPNEEFIKNFKRIKVGLEPIFNGCTELPFERTVDLIPKDDIIWGFGLYVASSFGNTLARWLRDYSRIVCLETLQYNFIEYIEVGRIPNFRAFFRRGAPDYYEVTYTEPGAIDRHLYARLNNIFGEVKPVRVYARLPLHLMPAQKILAKWAAQYPEKIKITDEEIADEDWILVKRSF